MKFVPDTEIKKISSAVRTKEDRELLLRVIGELQGTLYRSDPSRSQALEASLDAPLAHRTSNGVDAAKFDESIRNLLPERLGRSLALAGGEYGGEPAALKGFLSGLKTSLESMPVMRLDLAFDPTDEVIERIHSWVSQEVGEGIMLDIDVNKAILGGLKITWGGKYREYTLDKMIESFFSREREKILQFVR